MQDDYFKRAATGTLDGQDADDAAAYHTAADTWTPARIAAELALCERATPGPWTTHDGGWREHHRAAVNPWRFMFVVVPLDGPPKYPGHVASKFVAELKGCRGTSGALRVEADATFIAAARTGYPSALRALQTAQGEIERLTVRLRHAEAKAEIERLTAEREEARDWVRRLTSTTRVLTCAFCGVAYPPGTPESNDAALTAHVRVCPKHPMRETEAEIERLKALLGTANETGAMVAKTLTERDAEIERLRGIEAHARDMMRNANHHTDADERCGITVNSAPFNALETIFEPVFAAEREARKLARATKEPRR